MQRMPDNKFEVAPEDLLPLARDTAIANAYLLTVQPKRIIAGFLRYDLVRGLPVAVYAVELMP